MALKVCFIWISIASALQPLPPVPWVYSNTSTSDPGFSLNAAALKKIYIDRPFSHVKDTQGLTLIPPSARDFAELFRSDIAALFGGNWSLEETDDFPDTGILLGRFRGDVEQVTYENGVATEEGYEIQVANGSVYIGGTGARGMFWGTRLYFKNYLSRMDLLDQGMLLTPLRMRPAGIWYVHLFYKRPLGTLLFLWEFALTWSPMVEQLDAGRKYYTASFLKELCTYASFFKLSEFHYHSSDNSPLNRGYNDTWSEVFSHFSLYPEKNTELQGLIQRPNETLSRADFEDLQSHCAQRGITIIPEIEAPGHALAITKWKPELSLTKKDLLNLSHPDAIPTVKAIWIEFLPWFQTKEVHIGADEYDPDLANDYINFVNEMALFINTTSAKRIRIWGTHEPSNNLTLSKDIMVQHWQYGQSDPVELQETGYKVINSEDWWAYMSLKNDHTPILPAPYPQLYNTSRTMNFANVAGWQWDPALFNPVNTTEQLQPSASGNKGAILAAWNDNGPDATTQLEAYYAIREGMPVMAARAWSGGHGVKINAEELWGSIALLAPKAPGQSLDRRLLNLRYSSPDSPLLSWTRQKNSDITVSAVTLGKASYGPPYTLTLNVSSPFTLSGPDSSLSLVANSSGSNGTNTATLVFTTADNFPYPLRSVSANDGHDARHPGRIWTNQSSSSHETVSISLPVVLRVETDIVNGSRVWVDNEFAGRFEVFVFGGRNTLFSWSQMALVAPLEKLEGGIDGLTLQEGKGAR